MRGDIVISLGSETLTVRQIEVLVAVGRIGARGAATELFLSEKTIKKHLCEIRWKLRVTTTTRAIIVALQLGYFTLEDLYVVDHKEAI